VDPDIRVKLDIYGWFAETGRAPSIAEVASRAGLDAGQVRESWRNLRAQRLLVLDTDGSSIRMAPPFSGVATDHVVESGGVPYFANCAWDALGVIAALRRPGIVHSRCAQSGEPLDLEVGPNGPGPSSWRFHCLVPAAKWWDDIVFT